MPASRRSESSTSVRRIRSVSCSQLDTASDSAERCPSRNAPAAIPSALSRGPMGRSADRSRRTSTAARQRHSSTPAGGGSSDGRIQGGNLHHPASTPVAASGSRARSDARLAVSTSSHGSIRGTAHTAMLMAPCIASSSSKTTNVDDASGSTSANSTASSESATTRSAVAARSTFETLRANPSRRRRSSSVDTEIPQKAKAGSAPGQYNAASVASISPRREDTHLSPRRTETARAGSFAASSLMRTTMG